MKAKGTIIAVIILTFLFVIITVGITYQKSSSPLTNEQSQKYSVVVIDPGHGGVDGGAEVDGTCEKDINLSISFKLRDMLNMAGIKTVMTRESDISIHDEDAKSVKSKKTSDLHNRMKIMENNPGCIFVSIHLNKFPQSIYWGTQVFYSPNNPSAKNLAESIQSSVKQMLQPENNRQVKKCDESVYLIHESKVPAVLAECGFLSNDKERELLKNEEYQYKLAFSIMCGILNYDNTVT